MKIITYFITVLILSISFNKLLVDAEVEHYIAPPQIAKKTIVKTFDSEVHRLALKYKQNETLARDIIRCEGLMYQTKGNNKNYDKNGLWWSTDLGWWQINDFYHLASAKKLGFNINNEWDNLEYGFILLSQKGTAPWSASAYCWSKPKV